MELRDLRKEDFDELSDIVMHAYSESRFSLWFSRKPTKKHVFEVLDAKLAACDALTAVDKVAVEDGRVIGECEIIGGNLPAKVGIIVRADFRSKGVGKALLREALKDAKEIGVSVVYAEIAEPNSGAIRFFKRSGFNAVGLENAALKVDGKNYNIVVMELSVV